MIAFVEGIERIPGMSKGSKSNTGFSVKLSAVD